MSPLVDRERAGQKWDKAARYLRIAGILHAHPGGIRAEEIAEQVGVSRRTVYRDLLAIERDGALLLWQEKGRWGLDQKAFLPPLKLTLHEATALFLAGRVMLKATDEQDTDLTGAFAKLASILPELLARHIHAAVAAYARLPRNEAFTRVLRTLAQAWAERRVVVIDYEAGVYDPQKGPRRTRVRPWLIEPSALTHGLYLIGWDEERSARRTFKIERIRSAILTLDAFELPDDFDLMAELTRAWDVISDQEMETVVARFLPGVARRVAETRWHPSQEIEWQPDGSLVWRARVAGLHEVRIWLLGWGADVEVLGPDRLRDGMAEELRRAAARYAEPAATPRASAARRRRSNQ
ncbi:MAG TPA: WYL domain-containing protein [Candidatus Limnocylindrales bacterium]|nr:WYL domain-containing protein [Candidatus Limnocylindrales bacterium]